MPERICSTDGCSRKHNAKGLCKRHYSQRPDQVAKAQERSARQHVRAARRQQDRERDGGPARRAYKTAWAEARVDWGAWWERQRLTEDRADLKWKPKVWPHCRLNDAPRPRHFLGWHCRSCAEPFVYYTKRAQSPYCAECNDAHHRRPANRRAQQNGALYEVIVPRRVFERDGWRCQLCKRKTRAEFPHPRSATVDHIVPLAKGGDHTYVNVQCACFECNCLKRDGSANDQLRLVA